MTTDPTRDTAKDVEALLASLATARAELSAARGNYACADRDREEFRRHLATIARHLNVGHSVGKVLAAIDSMRADLAKVTAERDAARAEVERLEGLRERAMRLHIHAVCQWQGELVRRYESDGMGRSAANAKAAEHTKQWETTYIKQCYGPSATLDLSPAQSTPPDTPPGPEATPPAEGVGISDQLPYRVDNSDTGDETYDTLVGPDGFACTLTEPEDRIWCRDGKEVVDRLNEQAATIAAQREAIRGLVEAWPERADGLDVWTIQGGTHWHTLNAGRNYASKSDAVCAVLTAHIDADLAEQVRLACGLGR